ncbi:BRO domain-containing protein [Clostridium perfringens]|uniref:BRO domain-containing protein n=1 Tax=Clostridium perfringens TaxID=1502 RepID=A0A2X2Y9L0_CLOPF|nr:ORF6C domain-containing protein [Clostridium perfringens]SQB60277.1 BRO domain-containing protein [Clostridium perfringens]
MKMNNLMIFENKELGIDVKTIKNDDGSISIDIESTAKGFGWTRIAQSGNEVVRWDRINKYISELGPYPQVGTGDYIPESLFYLLAMKANNEVARKFQTWLAVEVIPAIRKSGQFQIEKKPTSAIDLFEAQVQALREVEVKVEKVDKKFEDLPLISSEPEELQRTVRQVGTKALGGHGSPAYKDKSLSSKVYKNVWKFVKDQFNVNTYKSIKRKHLSKAKEIAESYKLPFYLQEEINMINNQSQFNI